MKKIIILSLLLYLFVALFLAPDPVFAKKKIIRKGTTGTTVAGTRLIIGPKLRSDRRALIVNFSNLGAVSSFSYELMYTSEGNPQGVMGTITPAGEKSLQRELLFGTCSRNVCKYHRGIKDMKFVVTSTLKSGLKVRKTFKIKV